MNAPGKFLIAVAVISLMTTGSAFADGIQVGGHLVNVTVANEATNMALGPNATATQSIGAINGNARVNGNLTNVTVVGEAINLARGAGTHAEMSVNSIEGDTHLRGGTKRTVFVKRIVRPSSPATWLVTTCGSRIHASFRTNPHAARTPTTW